MTNKKHENDPEECPGDALVPLEPGLHSGVRVEGRRGLLQPDVDLVRAVDHDDGGGHAHHERVHREGVPTYVLFAQAEISGLKLQI